MFSQNKSVFKLLQVAYEKKNQLFVCRIYIFIIINLVFTLRKFSYIDLFLLDYCYSLNINICNCLLITTRSFCVGYLLVCIKLSFFALKYFIFLLGDLLCF